MTGPLHQRAKVLFLQALRIPGKEREAFVERGAGGDSELRDEVLSLLTYHSEDGPSGPVGAEEADRLQRAVAGRYHVEGIVGSGGMARVYRARDLKHDREVAIKVLRPEAAAMLGSGRFLREIRIAAKLHHPHILQLYDSAEAEGLLYYVMPYVEDGSLRDRLRAGVVTPVGDAVRILREVVDALSAAHASGVVHRDVKPDNVMMSGSHALVSDFGVAKALHDAAGRHATGVGVVLGTPAYMAPEQARADPTTDHRADIYAVGALGYELLTGDPPVGSPASVDVQEASLATVPRHAQDLPEALSAVLLRCLAERPEDRWQSASELGHALEVVAAKGLGLPAAARAGRSSPSRRFTRSAVTGLGALVVSAALLWAVAGRRGPAVVQNRVLVAGFSNETGDTALDHLDGIASDWFTRGLVETGVVQVVDRRAVTSDSRGTGRTRDETVASALGLAREARASMVLSGSYYRRADEVMFQVQLTHAPSGQSTLALEPMSGPVDDPIPVLDELRRRLMTAIADQLETEAYVRSARPPTYEAYRELLAAMNLVAARDLEGARQRFLQAVALDTSFALAHIQAAAMSAALGRFREADSVMRVVRQREESLSPVERDAWEALRARLAGDWGGFHTALDRIVAALPLSVASLDLASAALLLNRPGEALRLLGDLDPARRFLEDFEQYWQLHHDALHLAGEYEVALEVARRGRRRFPNSLALSLLDVGSLAALGRTGEITRRFDQALARPAASRDDLVRGMLGAGAELQAHGYAGGADTLRRRAREALAGLPRSPSHRMLSVELLHDEGSWAEARTLLDGSGEEPDSLEVEGYRGVLAARTGDAAVAEEVQRWMQDRDEGFRFGEHTLWRARIAAAAGDRAGAISLLRQSLAQGLGHGMWLHRSTFFEPIRDDAGFRALCQPAG